MANVGKIGSDTKRWIARSVKGDELDTCTLYDLKDKLGSAFEVSRGGIQSEIHIKTNEADSLPSETLEQFGFEVVSQPV